MNHDALGNSYDDGVRLYLGDQGQSIFLSYADLATPARLRAAIYAQLGHKIPHYSNDQHAVIVRAVMAAAGMREAA